MKGVTAYRQISATSHCCQYLSMKQDMPKPLSPYFFLISSLEFISTFKATNL